MAVRPRRARFILALAAILAPACVAVAQQAPAPGAASPAEIRAAARELAIAQDTEGQIRATLRAIRGNLVETVARGASQLPPAKAAEIVDELLMPEFDARVGALSALLEGINARHYSVEEMRELAAFYRTPLGRRLLEVTPGLAAEAMRAGQALGRGGRPRRAGAPSRRAAPARHHPLAGRAEAPRTKKRGALLRRGAGPC